MFVSLRLNIALAGRHDRDGVVPDGVIYHRLLIRAFGPYLAVAIAAVIGLFLPRYFSDRPVRFAECLVSFWRSSQFRHCRCLACQLWAAQCVGY